MFFTGDNCCAVCVSLGLSQGKGGDGGDGSGPCEGGEGDSQKLELKLILLFFKASSLD